MVPPVALLALRIGFVTLLWVFVLAVVLTLRTDLFGPRPGKQRAAARPAPAPKPARAQRKANLRLVITEGALAGTTVPLGDQTVTIGRADSSTLVLTDDFVSNHHARLMRRDGTWYVEDLGSTNGTYLDRQKVTDPTPLPPGVPVRIGKTVLELRQ
ncbi:MAG TPA: FHA domain-containing protein [Mycobacteriales bacterium]|nr:FHA domain-containing protein [Mycobacteriales bacterium]